MCLWIYLDNKMSITKLFWADPELLAKLLSYKWWGWKVEWYHKGARLQNGERHFRKSCYDIGHICPIRAEILTHEHLGNVFILLFVWLVDTDFRQNYFHISHSFWDFGAKMSFFHYIINQKRKIFIKHCSPHVPKRHLYQRCVSI